MEKDRDEVIELLDVDRFKAFYRLYQDNVYGGRQMPENDKVTMAAMCKMALDIKTISEGTKKELMNGLNRTISRKEYRDEIMATR